MGYKSVTSLFFFIGNLLFSCFFQPLLYCIETVITNVNWKDWNVVFMFKRKKNFYCSYYTFLLLQLSRLTNHGKFSEYLNVAVMSIEQQITLIYKVNPW